MEWFLLIILSAIYWIAPNFRENYRIAPNNFNNYWTTPKNIDAISTTLALF